MTDICPDCGRPVETHAMFDPPNCPVIKINWSSFDRSGLSPEVLAWLDAEEDRRHTAQGWMIP